MLRSVLPVFLLVWLTLVEAGVLKKRHLEENALLEVSSTLKTSGKFPSLCDTLDFSQVPKLLELCQDKLKMEDNANLEMITRMLLRRLGPNSQWNKTHEHFFFKI